MRLRYWSLYLCGTAIGSHKSPLGLKRVSIHLVVANLGILRCSGRSYGALVQYVTNNSAISEDRLNLLAPAPLYVCIILSRSWASKRNDRTTLIAEWNSTFIVEKVTSKCVNTVVALHGASPNVLPCRDNLNVTAILAAHFTGKKRAIQS